MACFKRCRRVRRPFLPIEVIFKILLHIPADILHNVMRYVCKEWYNIIHSQSFISSHLLQAPIGLLLRDYFCSDFMCFMETVGCEIKINRANFKLDTKVHASCNGLCLLSSRTNAGYIHYVANPVTKELVTLPQQTDRHRQYQVGIFGLGYAASIGAYKAVYVWRDEIQEEGVPRLFYFCSIITVGFDEPWRCICTVPCDLNESFRFPISVKSFIYFAASIYRTIRALDLDTELFHFFELPKGFKSKGVSCFLPMGDYLAVVGCRDGLTWEVWVAREVKRVGEEWTRLPDINLESHSYLYRHISDDPPHLESQLQPAGWLKEGQLVLLKGRGQPLVWMVYNIKTGEISYVDITGCYLPSQFSTYVPSLVSV